MFKFEVKEWESIKEDVFSSVVNLSLFKRKILTPRFLYGEILFSLNFEFYFFNESKLLVESISVDYFPAIGSVSFYFQSVDLSDRTSLWIFLS